MKMEQQKQRPEAQNLKTASSGAFFFMVVSLPFDGVIFHFSSFLLLITALFSVLSYRWETAQHSLKKYKSVHVAFLAIALL